MKFKKLSFIPTQDKPGLERKAGRWLGGSAGDPQQSLTIVRFMEPSPPETWHPLVGERWEKRCGEGGVGSSAPVPRPLAWGGGLVCPVGLVGQRKLAGPRSAELGPAPRGGGWGGEAFWGVSHLCRLPVHPAICCQTSPGKSLFLLRLINVPVQINSSVWVSLCVNKATEGSLGALLCHRRTLAGPSPPLTLPPANPATASQCPGGPLLCTAPAQSV